MSYRIDFINDVLVSVVSPEGFQCTAYPADGQMPDAPVAPNVVTVVAFHYR
jgi:hypothetical protein